MSRKKKKRIISQLKIQNEKETDNNYNSNVEFCIEIQYSYSFCEVAFLYLKMYQIAVKRYYSNVMKSIYSRKKKRSKRGKVEKLTANFDKALENLRQKEKKDREGKACIFACCFIKLLQELKCLSEKYDFKSIQVGKTYLFFFVNLYPLIL